MKHIISGLTILFIYMAMACPVSAEHIYYNGDVKKISKGSIHIEEKQYVIDINVRVVQHVKISGAIYEKPAKLSDVKAGDRITAKIEEEKNIITEIIIETYREESNK